MGSFPNSFSIRVKNIRTLTLEFRALDMKFIEDEGGKYKVR